MKRVEQKKQTKKRSINSKMAFNVCFLLFKNYIS